MRLIYNVFQTRVPIPLSVFSRCLDHVAALMEAIPKEDPVAYPPEPVRGYLFAEGPTMVDSLVRALSGPGGHPDDAAAIAALDERQTRAVGWLVLHRALKVLADRAGEHHRQEQAAANREALAILRGVRERARLSTASKADLRRLLSLAIPEIAVLAWQRRTTGRRR